MSSSNLDKATEVVMRYHFIVAWDSDSQLWEAECVEYHTAVGSATTIQAAVEEARGNAIASVESNLDAGETPPDALTGPLKLSSAD